MFEKVVRGHIVTPEENFLGEIGIINGKIEEVSKMQDYLDGETVHDFGNDYIFPGFIDTHVHCYSNPNEGIQRASMAAAKGGITLFIDMPYDLPTPVTNKDILNEKIDTINKESVVDIALWGTVPKENGAAVVDELADNGVAGFKLSTFETDPYRFPRISDADILETMKKAAKRDLVVAFHAENDELLTRYIEDAKSENHVEPIYHNLTRPPVTETTAVIKLLDMATWADAKLHIVHVSHAKSIEYINWFKAQGANVTAETCYNYLLLTTEDLKELGPKAKINPPLREPDELKALEKQLLNGSIDFITSDHAPWQKADKSIGNDNIFKAKSGSPGLEFMIPLLFDYLIGEERVTLSNFAELLALNPAQRFNLDNKGSIEQGKDADFTVINHRVSWQIDENEFISISDVSPFHEHTANNRIEATIVRGEMVYTHDHGVVEKNSGQFVKPSLIKDCDDQ
ncbi:dihydroorotase family protein [Virgibacillus sp. JSM 102003]